MSPEILVFWLLTLLPAAALGGSICGTVTDSASGLPVAGAGVFARHADGSYADAAAVTDAAGSYCIDGLDAGTYTVEIRVDDYVTAYVNGVEVAGGTSDVPAAVSRSPVTLDPPWPNPAADKVRMRVHVAEPLPVTLEIFDARGRLVRRWASDLVDQGTRDYRWDGLDRAGRRAPAGFYMIRLRSERTTSTRHLILVR